jgi:hypothetical protein
VPDFDWLIERNLALTVLCPYCHSAAGEACIATNIRGERFPMRALPAHTVRTKAARIAGEQTAAK